MMARPETSVPESESIHDDILRGARTIAREILGDETRVGTIYYQAKSGHLPTFRIGGILCARRSTLREHFRRQEEASLKPARTA